MDPHEVRFTVLIWLTRLSRNALSGMIPPLIPILAVALEYPLWQLGLLVTVFSLGSGVGQAPFGYLADKYDRRYILPTGLGIAGASYLLFAAAPRIGALWPAVTIGPFDSTFLVMILSMLVCGIGTAVVHPTLYPMISENVREANKGKVMGVFGSAAKVGDAMTPILVGILILVLIWEGIVMIVGLFGVVFSLILFVTLSGFDTEPAQAHMDEEEQANGDSVWESDNREYVYPMLVIYLFFITRGFAGRGLKTFVPAFIVGVYGYALQFGDVTFAAESIANFYFSLLLVVGAGTQIIVGWFVDGSDARTVLIACMSTATVGILALAYLELSPLPLLVVLLVIGVGIWGLNPARDMLISQVTPAEREGRTFGYLWTASHLTGAFIPTLVGYIADTFGLRQSFGVLAIGTFLAAVSILLLYSDRVYVDTEREYTGHQPADS